MGCGWCVFVHEMTACDKDSLDGRRKEKALKVPGTEWDQDREGRGFSREAGEDEGDEKEQKEEGGYSFRGERLERWGLEVSRVWYS